MIGAAASSLPIHSNSSLSQKPLSERPGTRSGHPSYLGWCFSGIL